MSDFSDSVFAQTGSAVRGVRSRTVALGLLVLAVIPLLVVLLLAWEVQRRNLLERAEGNLQAVAVLLASGQEQLITGNRQLLATVSSAPVVTTGDWNGCNDFLQRLGAQFPQYASIGIIDLDGMVVCRSTQSSQPINLGDRPYFRQIVGGAPFATGEYLVGRVTGSKTVPYAHPVRTSRDALRAVAFLGMDLTAMQEALRAVPLPPGAVAVLTDGAGAVLASTATGPAGAAAVGRQTADEGLTQALVQGQRGGLRTRVGGQEHLHQLAPVKGVGSRLQVAVSAPADALVNPLARDLALLMGLMLALLLLYAVVIWRLGRQWLLRPLEQLVGAMREIELGHYQGPGKRIRRSRVREIRVLQRGLNTMWAGLARRARQRDEALAASAAAHAELHDVLNEMQDGFLILDRAWQIKFCNRRAATLLGHDPAQLQGRDFWPLFPGDSAQEARQAGVQAIEHGRPYTFENFHAHYNRWFELRFFAADGGIGVFLRDSSEHWEMIRTLRERERRYRELFESNPNTMWIFDVETLQFLAVNAAAVRRYGYTEAEFLAMRSTDIRPADDREQFIQSLREASAGTSLKDEPSIWRHLTKDGELMLVDIAHHAITFNGRPARLVMSTDVTSRLSTESRLRRQLERLGAKCDEASSALQASRQIVSGYLRMITAEVLPTLRRVQAVDAAAPAEVQRLRRQAARVQRLLDEAIKLTEVGRAPFEPVMADLSAMAGDLVKQLRRRDPERTVHVEIEPGLLCRCDPALTLLLLQALLDNAWKFTERQPSAWIRMGRVAAQGEAARIPAFFISDNGVGFDEAEDGQLFKPFTRLHSGAEFAGHGVGLATASAVVARHGGEISARSAPGQGATFTFTLEARPRPADLTVSEVVIESLPPWED